MNTLNTFEVVLIVIVFVGVIVLIRHLLSKGINAAAKVANKHILFRPEYQAERQLVSEPLTFETTASVQEIMRQLTAYVSPEATIPAVRGVIYQLSQSADHVTYAFGNKVYTRTFVAAVLFKKNGAETQGVFKFLRWKERDGMLVGAEVMKKLRKQVWSAFSAADPSVRVIGTPVESEANAPKAETGRVEIEAGGENKLCPSCGAEITGNPKFCTKCGTKL